MDTALPTSVRKISTGTNNNTPSLFQKSKHESVCYLMTVLQLYKLHNKHWTQVKLFLCLIKHYAMKIYGEMEV
jgi:hypothetical protein